MNRQTLCHQQNDAAAEGECAQFKMFRREGVGGGGGSDCGSARVSAVSENIGENGLDVMRLRKDVKGVLTMDG